MKESRTIRYLFLAVAAIVVVVSVIKSGGAI